MITVLMECRDQEAALARSLGALVPGAVEGLVREAIVFDHGSGDGSAKVADAAGCRFIPAVAMAGTIAAARSDWLFILETGACPLAGWIEAFDAHMASSTRPARLKPSDERGPFAKLRLRSRPLRGGMLIPKSAVRPGSDGLKRAVRGVRPITLAAGMHPAA
ncbi:glycosyltransferase family protein [Pararhizobium mangrovi]|uniref:Glycosyl transferase n=1 Tax=Pararhizobium mangrovi TaxID=2590452 RepID=A0A506U483_9HYPH|nr:glycosyl transferase [Pararhizobium mangrovi]TPW28136.1 glycosyl transferase [Pararhizobium mangrovi]